MTQTQPGWYTDPGDPTQVRFWDGNAWTDMARPAQFVASGAFPPPPPPFVGFSAQFGQQAQFGQPAQFGQSTPSGYPAPPATGGYSASGYPAYGATSRPAGSLWDRNRYSFIAAIVCAIYILTAVAAHFVFLGILPVLFTVRAFRRGESFAVGALILTVISFVIAIALIVGH